MKLDNPESGFNEEEYRKVLKTRNQNMVKLQRYRVGKQIERMQPTIHFMEEGRKNDQILIASDETEMGNLIRNHQDVDSEDEMLGKRTQLLQDVISL